MNHVTKLILCSSGLLLLSACQKAPDNSEALRTLQTELSKCAQTMDDLNKRLFQLEKTNLEKGKGVVVASDDNTEVYNTLMAFNEKLYELESMMKAAGLDSLSTNENAAVMTELVEEKALSMKREKYSTTMRSLRDDQRKSDSEKYGEAFTALEEKTRFRPRRGGNQGDAMNERETAQQEILAKYPDSYAATQIKSERVARNMFQGNYQDALASYKEYMQNSNAQESVNDFGMRNSTSLQYSLANSAIENGDTATARELIAALENSGDDMVFAFGSNSRGFGGPGRGPQENLISRNDAVADLTKRLK